VNASQLQKIKDLFESPIAFKPFIDEIPLGVLVLDVNRRVVLFNRAFEALTGCPFEQALGIPCYHILRSKICIKRCPVLHFNETSETACVESDLINRDRQMIPTRITSSPLKNLEGKIAGFLETIEDLRPLHELGVAINKAFSFANIIGKSPQMGKIFKILPVIGQSDSSVLITGETGTGKDLVAEAVHQASNRAKGSFIKVNCGALPETLLESELFGHQKGAFTGAVENKPGRFRLAHNGTLYLTEIGDLPLSLQVKLLTFLDDQVVYPLGSTKGFQVDVRVIAATHRNLEQMVQEKIFREDLLFRLHVVRLHLPPLKEREDDIRLLFDHFFNVFSGRFRKTLKGFSDTAIKILTNYNYPGNVRELRNIVEYAVNVCHEDQILPIHLPTYIAEIKVPPTPLDPFKVKQVPSDLFASDDIKNSVKIQTWTAMEKKMILEALLKARGHRSKAAEILGWGRSTLWRKMKQYGIDQ